MTPGQWLPIKFALLLLMIGFGLAYRFFSRKRISMMRASALYFTSLTAMYFAVLLGWILGWYRGNPGVIANIGVYLVYPFAWASFFWVNGFEETKKILIKSSFYAGVTLSSLILMAAMMKQTLGIDPDTFFIFSIFGISTGTQFDGLKLAARFLPYLIFAYVMLLEIGIAKTKIPKTSNFISKKKALGAAIVILAALLVSGRTVMLVCLAWFFVRTVPVFLYSYRQIGSLVIISTALILLTDFNQLYLGLESKIGLTSEPSEIGERRISQLVEGLQLVVNKPLFGYGVGHYFESVGSWQIEVTPVTVFVSHGLLITTLLLCFYLFVLYQLTNRHNLHYIAYPSFLFLIASTTNPMLLKFDFIWIFLLPFVTYGMLLSQTNQSKMNANSI
jgi:hypothetical protein